MRGAVTGAAAGEFLGFGQGAGSTDVARQISDELANRSLKNNSIRPQEISQGIIFFPAEAGHPKQLRLQLREKIVIRSLISIFLYKLDQKVHVKGG